MAAVIDRKEIVKGGSFLIEERAPSEIFTPEDFNEEHRMIADTTRQFMDAEVLPRIDELENKDWKLARELVKQAAELGLVGAGIPEEYGGLGLDQTSGALIAENIGRSASSVIFRSSPRSSACSAIIALRSEPRRSITAERINAAAPLKSSPHRRRSRRHRGSRCEYAVACARRRLSRETPRAALWRRSEGRRRALAR